MTVLQRIQREPAALLGLVAAAIGLAVLLGLDPTIGGGITALVGAAVVCLRYVVTPASEVVAQGLPDGQLVAGPASLVETGAPLASVGITTIDDEPFDDTERDLPSP